MCCTHVVRWQCRVCRAVKCTSSHTIRACKFCYKPLSSVHGNHHLKQPMRQYSRVSLGAFGWLILPKTTLPLGEVARSKSRFLPAVAVSAAFMRYRLTDNVSSCRAGVSAAQTQPRMRSHNVTVAVCMRLRVLQTFRVTALLAQRLKLSNDDGKIEHS